MCILLLIYTTTGSNTTPTTLTGHHVEIGQLIWSRQRALLGLWTPKLGRYHRLRNIRDRRGSPAAARPGWIPQIVWSFCSSWRLTCSKVKRKSFRNQALLSSPDFPEKVHAGRKGSFPCSDHKSQAWHFVKKWAPDLAWQLDRHQSVTPVHQSKWSDL